jgi:pimeloyl-ACP methyl ester carboxylesterase/class 3 adenylate cyclase
VPPPIKYARSGGLNIAYQAVGEGPAQLLMIPGWFSHLALDWEEPTWVRWCERIASFARIVRFDKRGTGLSDRPPGIPTPDERMEDARAVMDAAGLAEAHVLGWSEGGPLGVLLAVTHPDRVQSLVLYGTQATFRRQPDYPFGGTAEESELWHAELESGWGTLEHVLLTHPDADPLFAQRRAVYMQSAASPAAAVALARANHLIDVRELLPSIRAPTLVLSRRHDPVGPAVTGRYLAERIPGARFVELEGDEHIPWLGDAEALIAEIEHFLTGIRPQTPEPGVVRAILHCDIEGSTPLARKLGNTRWADLLAAYGTVAEVAIESYGGKLIDRTGDGLMAIFEGPVNAIRAALRLQSSAQELGARVRAGVHIGEVVERNGALRGIAVHLAARVMAKASGGEVLVSETVTDIVAGSALRFEDRGLHELKGIEGRRRLFAVALE